MFDGLNAPFGARCFLTPYHHDRNSNCGVVLMHLLALGNWLFIIGGVVGV